MSNHQEQRLPYRSVEDSLIAAIWKLAKVPLCLLIGCSASFGALLASPASFEIVLNSGIGIFLLAMGGATLNSLQEVDADRSMKRTGNRPLVRRVVSRKFAGIQSVILIVVGLTFLRLFSDMILPVILGVMSLILYNGVYTRLKQKTILAIFPGAVCGAMPPLIGFAVAGGDPLSYTALLVFVLLFLWQVPHFCLVLLRHRDDYLNSKQPSFIKLLSERGVRWLSCAWIMGLALVMMLFSVTLEMISSFAKVAIIISAFGFLLVTSYQLLVKATPSYVTVFFCLNCMLLSHMMLVAWDRFLQ